MSIEIVLDEYNLATLWTMSGHQSGHKLSIIERSTLFSGAEQRSNLYGAVPPAEPNRRHDAHTDNPGVWAYLVRGARVLMYHQSADKDAHQSTKEGVWDDTVAHKRPSSFSICHKKVVVSFPKHHERIRWV
ncbi:MAG: hypothetical protein R2867_06515 [Caldilineaceae bacterium]